MPPFPRFLKSIARSIKLAGLFAYGALELIVKRPATRPQRAEWLHQFCARAIRGMDVALLLRGQYPDRGFVISNHLGYLDIMAFAALHRCVFVSKAELRATPFLGWMTSMAGSVYVDRGRGRSALTAGAGMIAAVDDGIPVVFFPEGTTSDGSGVLKFHSGLLAQVMASGEPVTAAHVSYRLTQNNGPGVTVPSRVAFWDDTPLLTHVFRIVAVRGIEVEVRFADAPIAFSEGPSQRKRAATEARDAVLALRAQADTRPPTKLSF